MALVWVAACSGTVLTRDTSNALGECRSNGDCGGGLVCLCGTCSKACGVDADCADLAGAGCAQADSTAFQTLCYPFPSVPGVCRTKCVDSVCANGSTCVDGVFCGPSDCSADFSRFSASDGPPVSLRKDVMPIFGLTCAITDCHSARKQAAGLYLGPRCQYDQTLRACFFPDAVDPNASSPTPPGPLTEDLVNTVYTALLGPTSTAPAVVRVVPGEPDRSFLVDSMLGRTNDRGYTCENQDSSHEVDPKPCGDPMPLGLGGSCWSARGRASVDTIARWIAEGAQNN